MAEIRANSVLPAVRKPFVLETSDHVPIRGELASPVTGPAEATLVCVHPLTTHGGSMESHLFRKMSWRLPALANFAILRYNQRGAGVGEHRSGGEFDSGEAEGNDLQAVVDYVADKQLPNPWLVGWSFGTDVILKHGPYPDTSGAVLLSPPYRFAAAADLSRWHAARLPVTALVPQEDDYLRPAAAQEVFGPAGFTISVGPGMGHLWIGERATRFVLTEVVRAVAPEQLPLLTDWPGPVEEWNDLR